jgi:hypothetical protein
LEDQEEIEQAVDRSQQQLGPITVLVNNAGSAKAIEWAGVGTVVQRNLSDGAILGTHAYALPAGSTSDDRGFVSISHAAAYVSTNGGPLFRFAPADYSGAAVKIGDAHEVAAVLGSAAFVVTPVFGSPDATTHLFLDRPLPHGGFAIQPLGTFLGPIAAVRAGDHVAVSSDGRVTLYDEFGHVAMVAQNACRGLRRALTSRDTLFVLCEPNDSSPPTLAAYAL